MNKWPLVLLIFAGAGNAVQTDCPVIYKALTQDHTKEIFLCEARSTMVLTIGGVGQHPDILATVSYDEAFIKTEDPGSQDKWIQLYLPVSGKWFIIDIDKDKSMLTTEETNASDYYPDDLEESPLTFDRKTEVNNIRSLTKVK